MHTVNMCAVHVVETQSSVTRFLRMMVLSGSMVQGGFSFVPGSVAQERAMLVQEREIGYAQRLGVTDMWLQKAEVVACVWLTTTRRGGMRWCGALPSHLAKGYTSHNIHIAVAAAAGATGSARRAPDHQLVCGSLVGREGAALLHSRLAKQRLIEQGQDCWQRRDLRVIGWCCCPTWNFVCTESCATCRRHRCL